MVATRPVRRLRLSTAISGLIAALVVGVVGGWLIGGGQRTASIPKPAVTFGDGRWTVGTDIAEGLYISDQREDSNCGYGTLSGGVELVDPQPTDGRVAIRLHAGEIAEFESCGIWRLRT